MRRVGAIDSLTQNAALSDPEGLFEPEYVEELTQLITRLFLDSTHDNRFLRLLP
jgi:hypothetical protein